MNGLRLYVNFREVQGPYGGANAFLRTLIAALRKRGVSVTADPNDPVDVVLLNALTEEIDLAFVERLAERAAPIVHRKVGYRVSGPPELRAMEDGVVQGDRLQIAFSPYIDHTIFQSSYSRDVFLASGFEGPYDVIHNGVDEDVFNLELARGLLRAKQQRDFWIPGTSTRVAISTWSTDENKGFADYLQIDEQIRGHPDVELTLIGRTPPGLAAFQAVRLVPPQPPRRLAERLKRAHVLLQLARFETCSNALIEGINCGLPAIYLDSGSNGEIAGEYGVEYRGDFLEALARLREGYSSFVGRIPENGYRISVVVEQYLDVFRRVVEGGV